MTISLDDIRTRESRHVLQTYKRQPVAFVRGAGSFLYDVDGREYFDLVSGIGVTSLGHAHPGLAAAIAEQATTLLHTSNLYFHPFQAEAAARLSALSGLARAFFCNSGTEANEACLKFARRYWHTKGVPNRTGFVAIKGGFAGRTMGALSVTWDEHYRKPFMPLVEPVTFVDPTTPEALRAAVTETTAAVIIEPIRGEGGVHPVSPELATAVREACERTGTLLIADEVQTGLGRTGHAFHSQALGWRPDLISVGKALGSGVPVGAALVSEAVAETISAGDHGSTYGGNLLACRAALVFVEQLMEGGLIEHVRRVGAFFADRLPALAAKHALIKEVRGVGLIWGLELKADAAPVVQAGLAQGVVVNRTAATVVRLLPPLVITEAEASEALGRLDAALGAAGAGA